MPETWWARSVVVGACAMMLLGCQQRGSSPASPSPVANSLSNGVGPFTDEGDPYPPAAPSPAPGTPNPETPTTRQINIVGTVGFNAFDPNPIQAAVGDVIVWANSDTRTHHIVLDDGTEVGVIEPGATSRPIPLVARMAGYHCATHPSMIGSINGEMPPTPPPTFSSIRTQIFEIWCVACHSGVGRAGDLRLDANAAYDELVNARSVGKPGAVRVIPGDPNDSYLIHKLEGRSDIIGGRMPMGGPFLPQTDIDMIRTWIAQGAPNN